MFREMEEWLIISSIYFYDFFFFFVIIYIYIYSSLKRVENCVQTIKMTWTMTKGKVCSLFASNRVLKSYSFSFFFSFTDIHGYPLRVDGRKQHDRVLRSSSKDHQLMRVSRIFFCGEEAMNVFTSI